MKNAKGSLLHAQSQLYNQPLKTTRNHLEQSHSHNQSHSHTVTFHISHLYVHTYLSLSL